MIFCKTPSSEKLGQVSPKRSPGLSGSHYNAGNVNVIWFSALQSKPDGDIRLYVFADVPGIHLGGSMGRGFGSP